MANSPAIISLKAAKRKGRKLYYTRVPCQWGHVMLRSIVNTACTGCIAVKKAMLLVKREQKAEKTALANKESSENRSHHLTKQSVSDELVGKKLSFQTVLWGIVSGTVVKTGEHHVWIKGHGREPRMQKVTRLRKDWIIEEIQHEPLNEVDNIWVVMLIILECLIGVVIGLVSQ